MQVRSLEAKQQLTLEKIFRVGKAESLQVGFSSREIMTVFVHHTGAATVATADETGARVLKMTASGSRPELATIDS